MVPKTVILPCATCTNAWLDLHNSVQTKPPSLHLHCCTPLCQSRIVLLQLLWCWLQDGTMRLTTACLSSITR